MTTPRSLVSGFLRSVDHHPERLALAVAGRELTYSELADEAASIARALAEGDPRPAVPLTAVFAARSVTAYAGILGALLRGHGYVPLNREFPVERTRAMLVRSGARALVVDSESASQLDQLLVDCEPGLLVVAPDAADVADLARRWPDHRFLCREDMGPGPVQQTAPEGADAIAYLLFTSGSTGVPKGVMVAHRNVIPFVDAMVERYGIGPGDRFSQTFDLTFDLSVFDMFVCWERGASLHCPGKRELIQPGRFIRESGLTVWFSVPSTGILMKRLGALKPDRYPTLRWSLFCGEPLPAPVAGAWALAAPNSHVENLYGPTEVTIACTLYRWDPETSPEECENGLVPIGEPYPGMTVLVADDELQPVPEGEVGELLMCGPQVTPGYWKDRERTDAAFVVPPGSDSVHYRTGDLVRRRGAGAPLVYVRRKDHQIKVQGYRVELGEIEAVIRRESGLDGVVALGWPVTEQGAGGVVAFVEGQGLDVEALKESCARHLPAYMVPREVHVVERMPLNVNGKFDRKALLSMLEESVR